MGHLGIEVALLFDLIDWTFSAGAQKVIEQAKKSIFQPDGKRVFDAQALRERRRDHGRCRTLAVRQQRVPGSGQRRR